MIDLHPAVWAALKAVCPNTFRFYPNSFNTLPVIAFREAGNSSADSSDLLTPVSYQVDAWTKMTTQLDDLVASIDAAMRGLGFRRALSQEIYDPSGYRRQTMRFEGTYNALDGKLYSR